MSFRYSSIALQVIQSGQSLQAGWCTVYSWVIHGLTPAMCFHAQLLKLMMPVSIKAFILYSRPSYHLLY